MQHLFIGFKTYKLKKRAKIERKSNKGESIFYLENTF